MNNPYTDDPFYKQYKAVSSRTDLTGNDKVIFGVIANFQGDKDHAFPGIRRLAKDAGCSVSTVAESVKRLDAAGVLDVEHRKNGQSSWYRLTKSAPKTSTVTEESAPISGTVAENKSAPISGTGAPKTSTEAHRFPVQKKKDLIKDLTTSSPKTPKTKKAVQEKRSLVEPTLQLLKAEIEAKSYIVDPNVFFEYYNFRGWLVKGKPMKSWKTTLSRWNAKDLKDLKEGNNGQKTTKTNKRNFSTEAAAGEAVFAV